MQALSTFAFCYYGNRVTKKPIELKESAYFSLWYMSTIEVQRGIKLMICYGQQEISLSGYGIIVCSLESFKSVTHILLKFYKDFVKLTFYEHSLQLINRVSSCFILLRST